MSTAQSSHSDTPPDPIPNLGSTSKSKKKRNKKKSGSKAESDGQATEVNGTDAVLEVGSEDGEEEEEEEEEGEEEEEELRDETVQTTPVGSSSDDEKRNGIAPPDPAGSGSRGSKPPSDLPIPADTAERLEALAKERDSLRSEVIELRKSLESLQGKHEGEMAELQEQLEQTQAGKDHAETQYRTLRDNVARIKSQLGERLKADAAQLEEAHARMERIEEERNGLQEANSTLESSITALRRENEQHTQEIANLRSRATLAQQNWVKERDELIQREAYAREEFETARQAMQDWEVLAMEERSLRENLGERVAELEEQLSTQKEAYERAASERDTQSLTVDGLQRALQEIQDARRKELREIVEKSQAQVEELKKQLHKAEEASTSSQAELETTKKELERVLPFEGKVKEKDLLIGKLRHEAVILNDHLTKALRILKKGRPEENVDRQIVTNHLLHFLQLDRSDPKKFQVLQLIAALLQWTDEQREQAGLARPGTSAGASNTLRLPMSPFRRTPSTPSLNADTVLMAENSTSKETLAELWSSFLEREAKEGAGSRRGSSASTPAGSSKGSMGLGIS